MSRLRIVQVSDAMVAQALREGTRAAKVVANPLPEDAQLVAVHFDGRTISLTYRSEAFDEVPDGAMIPYLDPMYQVVPT